MPGSHGEVLWPRLVANKILRKGLGSNNFVADFPSSTEALIELSSLNDDSSLVNSSPIFIKGRKTTHNYKFFVSTWNVGGVAPNDDLDMEELLETNNSLCDIYVIGFQEIVPLRTSSVLGSENSKVSQKWNTLIKKTLNKRISRRPAKSKEAIEESGIDKSCDDFRCIVSKQMVGILISVWVRSELLPYILHPGVSCVGCGIMGCLGNKGSVSVRFQLHETSFCFVCCHLACGGREKDERQRNSDMAEIWSRSSFPRGSSLNLPKRILHHDRVMVLGDLNYRISLAEEKTRALVDRKEWTTLLEHDQLRVELENGELFQGWHEGTIRFAPTYKYVPNSDLYYGRYYTKTEEKKRAPAWCDRIIWHGDGLKQHLYTRGESRLSDHRPVKAVFTAEVEILRASKAFWSLFLSSNRLGQVTFGISSKDDDHRQFPDLNLIKEIKTS